ncbi:MAG TPA: NEW3 domain-containing protein [Candidatus Limnocylindria bacterium]|nr:NEW3 domain-containing protein [Candidatus Limnocylindria bacterium]
MHRSRLSRALLPLALVASLVLPPSVAAQEGVELTTPYPAVAVEPGETVTFALTVTAETPQRVRLEVTEAPEGWTTRLRGGGFVIDGVTAGPDEPPEIQLEVEVPAEAEEGTAEVVVTATGTDGTAALPLSLRVASEVAGAVTLEAEFPSLRGAVDATFTFDLELTNQTPEETTFSLEAAGPEGWTVEARPSGETQASTVTVAPGESQGVQVEATAPEGIPAGDYPIAVRARGGGQQAEAELLVQIVGDFSLTVTTPSERLNATANAGSATDVTLRLINDGTAPLTNVELSATPPTDWEVTFEPEVVGQIAAGEFADVTARIQPTAEALAGDYAVPISATATEATGEAEIRTTVETSPLWGLVGVALIVAVLAGLWWVFRRFGRR